MKKNCSTKVIFYRVKDNPAKIQIICTKAKNAYTQEKRLLIAVSNLEAAQYIDSLLWRTTPESFIPHVIAESATPEWVAITTQDQQNVNQAVRLMNLCPTPSPLYQQVEEVYDLLDETHTQKFEFSKQRICYYQEKGFLVRIE
jgi:DNA polymerase III subunit chi